MERDEIENLPVVYFTFALSIFFQLCFFQMNWFTQQQLDAVFIYLFGVRLFMMTYSNKLDFEASFARFSFNFK